MQISNCEINMKNIILTFLLVLSIPSLTFAKYCKDFKTHQEAQAYFNAKKPGYKRLDRDKEAVPATVCRVELVRNVLRVKNK